MIALKDLTTFLPHVGARLGHYDEPPTASLCVEGGNFGGATYIGVAFSPSAPTAGTTRIDTVIADPTSGDLILVAGIENSGLPPELDSYAGAGAIADVHVLGRSNGKVLIERGDIVDRRSVIPTKSGGFQLIEIDIITLGNNAIPIVNSKVGGFTVVGSQKWTALKTVVDNKTYNASGSWITWLDLEFPRPVTDFHLVVQPYDSMLSSSINESGNHPQASGVSWVSLGSVAGKPRFRVAVTAAEGVSGEIAHRVLSMINLAAGAKLTSDLSVKIHLQAWGRV